jgi:hypothetical protein
MFETHRSMTGALKWTVKGLLSSCIHRCLQNHVAIGLGLNVLIIEFMFGATRIATNLIMTWPRRPGISLLR